MAQRESKTIMVVSVRLSSKLSDDIEQPDTHYGKYRDFALVIENYPNDGDSQRIVVSTQTKGGFELIKWKIPKKAKPPVIKVYMQVNIMGHELDQWVTYNLDTGERITS